MKTRMNRINCSKVNSHYLSNYLYYNYINTQPAEKNEIMEDMDVNLNSSNSSKADNQDFAQGKSESLLSTQTETAADIQNTLNPFVALEKLYLISTNAKKQNCD